MMNEQGMGGQLGMDYQKKRKPEQLIGHEKIIAADQLAGHLQLLLNSTAEGIYEIDTSGTCIFCNKAALRMLGYSSLEEVLGKNMHTLIHHSKPDGSALRVEDCKIFKAFGQGIEIHTDNEVFWTREGNSFPVEYWSYPICLEERVVGSVVTFLDITYRKQVEISLRKSKGKYRKIFETIQDVYIETDLSGIIVEISPSVKRILQYDREELIGCPVEMLYYNKDDREALLREMTKRGELLDYELRAKSKNNELIWISVNNHRLIDDSGNVYGIETMLRDISRRKQAEDLVLKSEANLKSSNATKDKLFSIIAHDLRGPIGNFEPILELLTSGEEISESNIDLLLKGLLNSAKSVSRLLENLLSWASSQSNGIELKPSYFHIEEIINRNVDLLSSIASQKEIEVEVTGDSQLNVFADIDSIGLVIRNLLFNSIKFTPNGGKISVSCQDSGNLVEVRIVDNGVGMTEGVLGSLMSQNLFFTSRGTNNEQGSGLGLFLCKDFVERNGGTIRVESVLGKGSMFIFTIPKE